MNRPVKIALGCLLAPVGLTVLGIMLLLGAKAMGVPDPKPASSRFEQPIPEEFQRAPVTLLESTPASPGLTAESIEIPEDGQIRVVLDLEQGEFRIVPGPAEDGIQVDASYDEASYELKQEYDYSDGVPVYRLRFESKVGWLRRAMQDGGISDDELAENEIEITLPRDTPIDLEIKMSVAAATELDFTGLSLTRLKTRMRMGEYGIICREPNPVAMRIFEADVSMGEFNLKGLGYLGASKIDIVASMGEVDVELGDAISANTEVSARMRMGEMTLRVPDNVMWSQDSRTKASLGEVNDQTRDRGSDLDPELSPILQLDANVFMGELVLKEFRADRRRRSNVR